MIVDPGSPYPVTAGYVPAKCVRSPFEGHRFGSTVDTAIANGEVVYRDGELTKNIAGRRLDCNRLR